MSSFGFVAPTKDWIDGIKKESSIRILQAREEGIRQILDTEMRYPMRNKYEILELKRKKVYIQARIQQLVDINFNRIKELL